jgi:hypothetical protein
VDDAGSAINIVHIRTAEIAGSKQPGTPMDNKDVFSVTLTAAVFFVVGIVGILLHLVPKLRRAFEETLDPGDRILRPGDAVACLMADVAESPMTIQLVVAEDGRVALPYGGSRKVVSLARSVAEEKIAEAVEKARAKWVEQQRAQAAHEIQRRVSDALGQVNESVELKLQKLHEATEGLGWQHLHRQYRVGLLQFARRGSLVLVTVQAAPSGIAFITWRTTIDRPVPYWVIVKQDRKLLSAERAYLGHITRSLACGADYTFTVEVYDDPPVKGQAATNHEPGFEFVVQIPTAQQWAWAGPKKRKNTTAEIVGAITAVGQERKKVEQAIDTLDLDPDEKQRMKAEYVGSKLRAFE